ncbi:MAG: ABC transporter ATP-binding protein, partial [Actinomycetota bacterium]
MNTVTPSPTGGVHLAGVGRAFDGRDVLAGLELHVPPGQFVALLGHSGSGKSTLLRLVAGLDPEFTGSVAAPERRAVVFQDPCLMPWKRVLANVVLGMGRADAAARGREVLEEVGLTDHARAWPLTLSGGEAQRVALARALIRDPDLLLLDEPFGALDALTRIRMQELLVAMYAKYRPTVLFVTHDVEEALLLADRVVVLEDGRVARDVSVDLAAPRRRTSPQFQA